MNTSELYEKLKESYSDQNLNVITITLINLYKEQQFSTLQRIASLINETVDIKIADDGKGFSKFMMLYHPDRGDYFRNEIQQLAENDDLNGLLSYSHILMLGRIEEVAATFETYEDIDYSPVYEWDFSSDGFTVVSDDEPVWQQTMTKRPSSKQHYSFYDAMKLRMYGKTDIDFPTYYLEDFDEFEMAMSEIDNLEGIEYCLHAITLDLSGNSISEITELSQLIQLRELNLSDNKIFDIEILANLKQLRIINLSNNFIDDISPLYNLENLEYVNISENKVKQTQIDELRDLGVTVITNDEY